MVIFVVEFIWRVYVHKVLKVTEAERLRLPYGRQLRVLKSDCEGTFLLIPRLYRDWCHTQLGCWKLLCCIPVVREDGSASDIQVQEAVILVINFTRQELLVELFSHIVSFRVCVFSQGQE